MSLKLKIRTQFPALVTAASPLTLVKTGLSYAFGFDLASLRASLDPIYLVGTITNFILSGATSGSVTLKAPAVAGSNTITVPAATDTLVGKATTDTLTNKTLTTPVISQPNIIGTTTNDSAAAGSVGEYIESVIASGSPVSLSTGVGLDVTTITLTAGDWDIAGNISYITAATTSITSISTSLSGTLNTSDKTPGKYSLLFMAAVVPTASTPGFALPVGPYRMSVAGNTVVHLVANASFSASTLTAYGILRARRVR